MPVPIHTAVAECLNLFSIPKRMAWHLSFSVPTRRLSSIQQYASHLQVIIDKLYQYAIIVSLNRHVPSCPESHARPPSGPSNSFNVIAPAPATLLSSRTNKANSHSPYVLPSSVSRKSIVCHAMKIAYAAFVTTENCCTAQSRINGLKVSWGVTASAGKSTRTFVAN